MRTCDHTSWFEGMVKCPKEAVRKSLHDRWRADQDAHWYCHKHWYAEYIRSSEWKHRREMTLRQRGNSCELCRASRFVTLQVHHLTYERVGAELDDDLVVLCLDCHKQLHTMPREPQLRSLKAIRLTTNFDDYRAFVSGESLPVSRLDQHWVARYQL